MCIQAEDGTVIELLFKGTLEDGTVFESTDERGPMKLRLGKDPVLPGFAAAVDGMKVGEVMTVKLSPAEAYGHYDETAVQEVDLTQVPEGVEVGTQLQSPNGQTLRVKAINDDKATLDFNHPLARQDIQFDITVKSVSAVPEVVRP